MLVFFWNMAIWTVRTVLMAPCSAGMGEGR